MGNILTLLSVAAPLALIITLWVLAQISRRFGEVTHRPPLYRGFYVAMALMIAPMMVRFLAVGLPEDKSAEIGGNTPEVLYHDIPLAVSITLAVTIAWRYWGWLVYASDDQQSASRSKPKNKVDRH